MYLNHYIKTQSGFQSRAAVMEELARVTIPAIEAVLDQFDGKPANKRLVSALGSIQCPDKGIMLVRDTQPIAGNRRTIRLTWYGFAGVSDCSEEIWLCDISASGPHKTSKLDLNMPGSVHWYYTADELQRYADDLLSVAELGDEHPAIIAYNEAVEAFQAAKRALPAEVKRNTGANDSYAYFIYID